MIPSQISVRLFLAMVLLSSLAARAPASGIEEPPVIWLGYYGELATHPGIAAGALFRGVDLDWYALEFGPVIGIYLHPRNHLGAFLDAELVNRFSFPGGLYFTIGAGAGYYHTWLAGGRVYVRSDGEIVEARDGGHPNLKAGGSLGVGFDGARTRAVPVRVFSRLDVFAQYPFNHAVLPHAAVIAGASISTRNLQ